ncbi:alpha/beta fold hydrolase [Alkalicoccus luteus]|uniref:Alpha/beta fold hydrolase n=1 Tax=Alkalicoccus luteus TaxID=1237094 RepID=A0A969TYC8_9BACI|nr:alpha/beta hydrolase [Alkalicoccus luteus]NJP39069.1 alpha/beta fold hydrolase [Alkalicoccus luteus]
MLLHTTLNGSGSPLLFLHAGLETGETDFVYQRDMLQSNFQVVTMDLRGHGRSQTASLQAYFETCADDVAETLLAHNIRSAFVVGASLGALVALYIARLSPEMVTALAVHGIIAEKPANWSELRFQEKAHYKALLENEAAATHFDNLHGKSWRAILRMAQEDDYYPFALTGNAADLSMPVLICAGDKNLNEASSLNVYKKQLTNGRTVLVSNAGHLVHQDQPAAYLTELLSFIHDYGGNDS